MLKSIETRDGGREGGDKERVEEVEDMAFKCIKTRNEGRKETEKECSGESERNGVKKYKDEG